MHSYQTKTLNKTLVKTDMSLMLLLRVFVFGQVSLYLHVYLCLTECNHLTH